MKYCNNCGAVIQDDAMFCLNCGTAVTLNEAPVAAPQAAPVYAEPVNPVSEAPDVPAEAPKKKGKGKLVGLIIGGVLLLALIAFLIVGFATNWFAKPHQTLNKAMQNTIDSQSITIKLSDGSDYAVTIKVVAGKKTDNAIIMTYYENDGYSGTTVMTDGKQYSINEEDGEPYAYYMGESYDNAATILCKLIGQDYKSEDTVKALIDMFGIDTKANKATKFLETLESEYLNNEHWLVDVLGFESEGNEYNFKIKLDKLIKEVAGIANDCGVITKDQKKQLAESDTGITIKVKITVEDNFVTEMKITMSNDNYSSTYKLKFSNIDSTKIDSKSIIDEVKKYYAPCDICGEENRKDDMTLVDGKYYCYNEYINCEYCYDEDWSVNMHKLSGNYYCDYCYNNRRCYVCSYIGSVYTEGKAKLCWECDDSYSWCEGCNQLVNQSSLNYVYDSVNYEYKYYCSSCYSIYESNHTCGLCYEVVGDSYICTNHNKYSYCYECGDLAYVYYNIRANKFYCYDCC